VNLFPFIIKENDNFFQIKWSGTITESSVIDCSKSIATFSNYPQKTGFMTLERLLLKFPDFLYRELPIFQK